jgi:hypothetical protein
MDAQVTPAPSVAEVLPEAYRRVLDRIADLEAAGYRREADLVRRDAVRAYSRHWDERTVTRLDRLAARAERVLAGRERPRPPAPGPRAAFADWMGLLPGRLRRTAPASGAAGRTPPSNGMTPERPSA